MDYTIVYVINVSGPNDIGTLVLDVNRYTQDGWVPVGSPVYNKVARLWYQALTRPRR
jgi:hypothetical protein